ncbi:hypothetical protein GLOIN_2v1883341 [Rhizophagus clarus]|uniref:Uncharacterized protein n=1 Tax=Rhizophagus clarus TaxID=94130 RepID=A0A8H3LWN3_9GLOM|nr:hypothetical protein GLOIN_2v1883341 [Rhizophagus clarus]
MYPKNSITFTNLEYLAIIKIKNIIEEYDIKYFKITKTKIYYKSSEEKYIITDFINNQNRIRESVAESDKEVGLNFTEDERENDEKMEIENNVISKRTNFQEVQNNQTKRLRLNNNFENTYYNNNKAMAVLIVDNSNSEEVINNIGRELTEKIKSKRILKDNKLKESILTTIDPKHRRVENFIYLEQTKLSNIFENCVTAEIRGKARKCELLQHYFRTGAFLTKILEKLNDQLSIYPKRSIITGVIKGTGISKIFESKYADDNVSPDAFMKVGGGKKNEFKNFVKEIKIWVDNNINFYNTQNPLNKFVFDFSLITDDITSRVKKFTENPNFKLNSSE